MACKINIPYSELSAKLRVILSSSHHVILSIVLHFQCCYRQTDKWTDNIRTFQVCFADNNKIHRQRDTNKLTITGQVQDICCSVSRTNCADSSSPQSSSVARISACPGAGTLTSWRQSSFLKLWKG